jgi:hypothetical protein
VPHRRDQVIVADHPGAVRDEELQHVENLRLDGNQLVAPSQFASFAVDGEVAESAEQVVARSPFFSSFATPKHKAGKSVWKIEAI